MQAMLIELERAGGATFLVNPAAIVAVTRESTGGERLVTVNDSIAVAEGSYDKLLKLLSPDKRG